MNIAEEKLTVKHETWANKLDFLISTMGLCIGFGNVWRFPYLCYKHGGGSFLIAYFISAIICGVPIFYIECFLGQITRRSSYIAWKFCPMFEGLGLGFLMVNLYLGVYLSQVLSWVFYYMFASFKNPLPWTYCDPAWATNKCLTNFTLVTQNSSYYTDPVNEYFRNQVLKLSPSINNIGSLNFPLVGCLLLAYIICYFVVWKGIRISGKIMYVTCLLPFLLLFVLLCRSCSLKGAGSGIKYYLLPNFKTLTKIDVWSDAGGQIFFSYAVACGVLTALASHNKLDHNVYLDSIRCTIMNSFCSIYAGFVIFPVLGFMAQRQNVAISDVVDSGPGLAFIAYPRALAELPGANIWSFFFFLALIFIGIDSVFITLETNVLCIEDILDGRFKIKYRKEVLTLIVSICSFIIGLSMVTNGGMYIFQIINYFPLSQFLIITGILEAVVVAWIYGYDRFQEDIKFLNLKSQGKIFKYVVIVLTPLFGLSIFILNTMLSSSISYDGYQFPLWATAVGWLLNCTILFPILGTAMYNFYNLDEPDLFKRFMLLFKCENLITDRLIEMKMQASKCPNSPPSTDL